MVWTYIFIIQSNFWGGGVTLDPPRGYTQPEKIKKKLGHVTYQMKALGKLYSSMQIKWSLDLLFDRKQLKITWKLHFWWLFYWGERLHTEWQRLNFGMYIGSDIYFHILYKNWKERPAGPSPWGVTLPKTLKKIGSRDISKESSRKTLFKYADQVIWYGHWFWAMLLGWGYVMLINLTSEQVSTPNFSHVEKILNCQQ